MWYGWGSHGNIYMYALKKPMVKFIIRSKYVKLTFYMLYTSTMSLRESTYNTNLYNLLFQEFAFASVITVLIC